MIELNLNLPFKVRKTDKEQGFAHNRMIFDFVLRNGIGTVYKDGLDRTKQRLWSPVLDALTDAIEGEQDVLKISKDQLQFVFDTLEKWETVPSPVASWFLLVIDHLKSVLDEAKLPDKKHE